MDRVQRAVRDYQGIYSCAQSVLAAFAPEFGIDRETAQRLSAAFGSGMGRGWMCGAVTGAMMVLGLHYGAPDSPEDNGEDRVHTAAEFFMAEFIKQNGSLHCMALLGVDPDDPDTLERAQQEDPTATRCPKYVKDAVEILECMLCPAQMN